MTTKGSKTGISTSMKGNSSQPELDNVERISKTDHLKSREDKLANMIAGMGLDPSVTSFSSQSSNSQNSISDKQLLKRLHASTSGFSERAHRLYMVRSPFNLATVKLGRTTDSLERLLKR